MRAIALSFLLFMGGLSGARGDVIPGSQRNVQGWTLAAFAVKGRGFDHCGIGIAYRNGIILHFTMSASRVWSIGWTHESWRFRVGQRAPLRVQVDNTAAYDVTGVAQTPNFLLAELPAGSPLYDLVRRGGSMTLQTQNGGRIGFSLDGTSVALGELAACVDRYTGVATASRSAPSQAAPAVADAADVPLTEAQVRSEIIGKDVSHSPRHHITFGDDGKLSAGDGMFGKLGTYRLEMDGRICWRMSPPNDAGCFQYYRRGAQLRVRRTDTGGDIGPVTVSAFNR